MNDDTERLPPADAERRRQRRINLISLPVVTGVALVLSGLVVTVAILLQQVHGLSSALTAQCQQTRKLGHDCVAAPAASVRANPDQPTVSAVPGPTGPAGRNGSNGTNGANGLSITAAKLVGCDLVLTRADGVQFNAGNVCGPRGPAGATGSPGPAGSQGPAGQNGQNGTNGQDGQPGPAGSPGPAGKPPASYTVEDPDGVTYECTRDAGSPDDAPTYTCQPASSPSASPSTLVRLR